MNKHLPLKLNWLKTRVQQGGLEPNTDQIWS